MTSGGIAAVQASDFRRAPLDHAIRQDRRAKKYHPQDQLHRRLGAAMAFPPGTQEPIRKIMEEALLKVGSRRADSGLILRPFL